MDGKKVDMGSRRRKGKMGVVIEWGVSESSKVKRG